MNRLLYITFFISAAICVQAQPPALTLEQAIQKATLRNGQLIADSLAMQQWLELKKSAFDPGKTQVFYEYDENNIAENGQPIRVWGISQSFDFPTVYTSRARIYENGYSMRQARYRLERQRMLRDVTRAYYTISYLRHKQRTLKQLDSLYDRFSDAVQVQLEAGEGNRLDLLQVQTLRANHARQLSENRQAILAAQQELSAYMQTDTTYRIELLPVEKVQMGRDTLLDHPSLDYARRTVNYYQSQTSATRQQWWPSIQLSYFNGTNSYPEARVYEGVMVGVGIPLFFTSQHRKVQAARIEELRANHYKQNQVNRITLEYQAKHHALEAAGATLQYYEEIGTANAKELFRLARISYDAGDIDFIRYLISIENAAKVELDYLESLHRYNQLALSLMFFVPDSYETFE